jgi:WD40 repeat protein
VKIWDTTSHTEVGQPLVHAVGVFALTFNEDGKKLLVAGYSQDIFVWDVSNPAAFTQLKSLTGHSATVNSLAYNWAHPPLLTSTSDDKSLLIWDVAFAEPSPKVLGLNESMEAVTFNPRGDWLASATDNKTVLLWQLDAARCAQKWDPPTCQPARLGTPLAGHAAPVENVVFLSNNTLVSSSEDGQLILWNLDKKYWYNRACNIVNREFNENDPEYIQYIAGKIDTRLLNTVNWFSDRFGSGVAQEPPACLGNN